MYKGKNILGLIPARGGSKGIPKKNLALLNGRPLIDYTIEAAKRSSLIDRLILSTDNEEIANYGKGAGIEVPFLRPRNLAQDETSMPPVIRHTVEFLQKRECFKPDVIVLLQPISPFRKAEDIDQSIRILIDRKADSVVSVCEPLPSFHPDVEFEIRRDALHYCNPKKWLYKRRQDRKHVYFRNGAVYVIWVDRFLRKKDLYGRRCLPYVMPFERSVNIDTLLELEWARFLLSQNRHD